jgi:hypothetical protein
VIKLDKLVQEFAENVAAQTEAIKLGDAKTGNQHARRYIRALRVLRTFGDAGRDALLPLFRHARADVRGAAAAHLLRYRTTEARAVLSELASGRGLAAFEASETLKRWEEGTWALDPAD